MVAPSPFGLRELQQSRDAIPDPGERERRWVESIPDERLDALLATISAML